MPCYCTVHVEFLFVPAFRGAPAATICSRGAPAKHAGSLCAERCLSATPFHEQQIIQRVATSRKVWTLFTAGWWHARRS